MSPDSALDQILAWMDTGSVDDVEQATELFDGISEVLRSTGRLVAGELAYPYNLSTCPCCGETGYDDPTECSFCEDQEHVHYSFSVNQKGIPS